jgi:hypothetical protein
MKASVIISALDLPASATVDQRVPKKLLLENGAPTAADKRRINEGIDELVWLAALKPTTVGIAEYRDVVREYVEIAVLHLVLRAGAKAGRLIELVHRAVPYPVLLIADYEERLAISAAHKRWSEGEGGKTVLDGELIAVESSSTDDPALVNSFCEALSLRRQPRNSLHTLYQGWIDALLAFEAARITGEFVLPGSPEQAAARRDALREHARLEAEIVSLRVAAESETQIPRQVELNLEMQRRRGEIVVSKKTLSLKGPQ